MDRQMLGAINAPAACAGSMRKSQRGDWTQTSMQKASDSTVGIPSCLDLGQTPRELQNHCRLEKTNQSQIDQWGWCSVRKAASGVLSGLSKCMFTCQSTGM